MAQPGAEPGADLEPGTQPGAQPGADPDVSQQPGSSANDNDTNIICICGKPFEQMLSQNCYDGKGVLCDICGETIWKDSTVYHCLDAKTKIHEGGYDLCTKCATKELLTISYEMGTEGPGSDNAVINAVDIDADKKVFIPNGYISDANNPPCICGKELILTAANKAYGTSGIKCDLCSKSCMQTDPIYHCLDEKCPKHNGGYDLCFDCGWVYVEYKMDEASTILTLGNDEDALLFAPGTAGHTEQIQTEALVPVCICDHDLVKTDSRVYGEGSGGVICDNCRTSCTNDDIVYHCPMKRNAAEHKGGFDLCEPCAMKQNKRIRTNWLSDLFEDMVVTIARFVINKRPSSVMILKKINKYWYQCLNPNKSNVNALWQYNICRPMFPHIPPNLKIKRWDRFYQYRYYSILKYRKDHTDKTKINKKLVYTKYKMIENCTHDINEINAFYRAPFSLEDDGSSAEVKVKKKGMEDEKDLYDGYFEAQFGSHGLPKGYKWKLECPVLALKLKKRGDNKYYCGVCKKNVYVVENAQEMKMRVDRGQCVQYTMSGKPSLPESPKAGGHHYPTPRRGVKSHRGKVRRG